MTQDSSTVADRLARVREGLRDRASEALCLHSLDDIAWLTGCRAADIKFNPVFLASMIVTDSEALLYTEASRFTPELLGALAAQGIEVRAPESLAGDISALSRDLVFMADPDRLPASIFGLLERVPVEALSPVTLMKSRKSEEELEGIRRAMSPTASRYANSTRCLTSDSPKAPCSPNPTSRTCSTQNAPHAPTTGA